MSRPPAITAGLLKVIRDSGRRAGLVLNPDTPLERVLPFLDAADYILLMSVFPGFGGQAFIPGTLERAARMRREITRRQSRCLLQVDGGINSANAALLREAGADLFVVGTSLFQAEDIGKTIETFLNQLHWSRP